MPGLRHGPRDARPGRLDSWPPRARGPFPSATELLCDGGLARRRWRREGPVALTHLEEEQIGLKKEKEKQNLSSVQTEFSISCD